MAGGNENGILVNPESNRLKSLKDFPLLYPDAGVLPPESYGYKMMELTKPPFWDGKIDEPAAGLQLGRPHRGGTAPAAVSRLAEHQPDARRGHQHDARHGAAHHQGRVLPQPQLQGAEHGHVSLSRAP